MNDPTPLFLLAAVFAPVLFGLLTFFLPKKAITERVLLALMGPLTAFILVLVHLGSYGISPGGETSLGSVEPTATLAWIPILELNFAFLPDGLGLFFGLLVSGVGCLIVLYARGYFGPDADSLHRFLPTLCFFMTAMLGVVLADNTLLTLLFWELTSISSFLLIGWDRDNKHAVKLAMQAFFTTGVGGMALFGGIILFGQETGIWRWSQMYQEFAVMTQAQRDDFFSNHWVITSFCLMFAGAAGKSAQWPCHYWLPGAMAAPTPVSAFLHSATMVKAGVYLTGRLFPVLSLLTLWPQLIIPLGAVTMLLGGILAINQHDLKKIFAYTTVSQLGLLMCMYGLGALEYIHEVKGGHGVDGAHDGAHGVDGAHGAHGAIEAAKAATHYLRAIDLDITQIANHAFYKAPLFIVAGAIGHVMHTRDLPKLFGLWQRGDFQKKAMVVVILLAAYALAGGPGTLSFPAKEMFLYAIYHCYEGVHKGFAILAVMTVLTAMCNVAIFVRLFTTLLGIQGLGLKAKEEEDEHGHAGGHAGHGGHGGHGHDDHHHDSPIWASMMWVPGAIIVLFQYIGGIVPGAWNAIIMPFETNANYDAFIKGAPSVFYALSHPSPPLLWSGCAIALGVIFGLSPACRGVVSDVHNKIYPATYSLIVNGGGFIFRRFQTGHLTHYIYITVLTFMVALGYATYRDSNWLQLPELHLLEYWPGAVMGALICLMAILLPLVKERIVRILVLGSYGFSVVGMYLTYQAPDLALTQLMFEIISVILFLLVLRMIPANKIFKPENGAIRLGKLSLAIVAGISVGLITFWSGHNADTRHESDAKLGHFFKAHSHYGTSYTEDRGGAGDNIVNVILVDFRGFDTFGEITVLAIAALGVWALLPGRGRHRSNKLDKMPEQTEVQS